MMTLIALAVGVPLSQAAVTVNVKATDAPYVYAWFMYNNEKVEPLGTWPGTQPTEQAQNLQGEAVWHFDIDNVYHPNPTYTTSDVSIIIHNGNGAQTGDIVGLSNGQYEFSYDGSSGYKTLEICKLQQSLYSSTNVSNYYPLGNYELDYVSGNKSFGYLSKGSISSLNYDRVYAWNSSTHKEYTAAFPGNVLSTTVTVPACNAYAESGNQQSYSASDFYAFEFDLDDNDPGPDHVIFVNSTSAWNNNGTTEYSTRSGDLDFINGAVFSGNDIQWTVRPARVIDDTFIPDEFVRKVILREYVGSHANKTGWHYYDTHIDLNRDGKISTFEKYVASQFCYYIQGSESVLLGDDGLDHKNLPVVTSLADLELFPNITSIWIEYPTVDEESDDSSGYDSHFSYNHCDPSYSRGDLDAFTVPKLAALTHLELNSCGISSIDLSNAPYIRELQLRGNELTSITLSGLSNLYTLDLDDNQLQTIDVSNNTRLTNLYVSRNPLSQMNTFTPRGDNLYRIEANVCGLNSIDLSHVPNLEYLQVGYNNLQDIDLTGLTKLTELFAGHNKLTAIDVSPAANTLKKLALSYNQFTSFNAATVPATLQELYLNGNQMASGSLNISPLTKLQRLEASNCNLSSITFPSAFTGTNKVRIELNNNRLGTLDVSQISGIEKLEVGNCRLSSITLGNQPDMTSFDCSANLLQNLDLSGCSKLDEVVAIKNQLNENTLIFPTATQSGNGAPKRVARDESNLPSSLLGFNLEPLKRQFEQSERVNGKQAPQKAPSEGTSIVDGIMIMDNNFRTIDLSGMTNLEYIVPGGNQLTALDLSDAAGMSTFTYTLYSMLSDALSCGDMEVFAYWWLAYQNEANLAKALFNYGFTQEQMAERRQAYDCDAPWLTNETILRYSQYLKCLGAGNTREVTPEWTTRNGEDVYFIRLDNNAAGTLGLLTENTFLGPDFVMANASNWTNAQVVNDPDFGNILLLTNSTTSGGTTTGEVSYKYSTGYTGSDPDQLLGSTTFQFTWTAPATPTIEGGSNKPELSLADGTVYTVYNGSQTNVTITATDGSSSVSYRLNGGATQTANSPATVTLPAMNNYTGVTLEAWSENEGVESAHARATYTYVTPIEQEAAYTEIPNNQAGYTLLVPGRVVTIGSFFYENGTMDNNKSKFFTAVPIGKTYGETTLAIENTTPGSRGVNIYQYRGYNVKSFNFDAGGIYDEFTLVATEIADTVFYLRSRHVNDNNEALYLHIERDGDGGNLVTYSTTPQAIFFSGDNDSRMYTSDMPFPVPYPPEGGNVDPNANTRAWLWFSHDNNVFGNGASESIMSPRLYVKSPIPGSPTLNPSTTQYVDSESGQQTLQMTAGENSTQLVYATAEELQALITMWGTENRIDPTLYHLTGTTNASISFTIEANTRYYVASVSEFGIISQLAYIDYIYNDVPKPELSLADGTVYTVYNGSQTNVTITARDGANSVSYRLNGGETQTVSSPATVTLPAMNNYTGVTLEAWSVNEGVESAHASATYTYVTPLTEKMAYTRIPNNQENYTLLVPGRVVTIGSYFDNNNEFTQNKFFTAVPIGKSYGVGEIVNENGEPAAPGVNVFQCNGLNLKTFNSEAGASFDEFTLEDAENGDGALYMRSRHVNDQNEALYLHIERGIDAGCVVTYSTEPQEIYFYGKNTGEQFMTITNWPWPADGEPDSYSDSRAQLVFYEDSQTFGGPNGSYTRPCIYVKSPIPGPPTLNPSDRQYINPETPQQYLHIYAGQNGTRIVYLTQEEYDQMVQTIINDNGRIDASCYHITDYEWVDVEVPINKSTKYYAASVSEFGIMSNMVSMEYIYSSVVVPMPTFNPAPGTYRGDYLDIEIVRAEGHENDRVFFTVAKNSVPATPTTSDREYTNHKFRVNDGSLVTVKAIAMDAQGNFSPVNTGEYIIREDMPFDFRRANSLADLVPGREFIFLYENDDNNSQADYDDYGVMSTTSASDRRMHEEVTHNFILSNLLEYIVNGQLLIIDKYTGVACMVKNNAAIFQLGKIGDKYTFYEFNSKKYLASTADGVALVDDATTSANAQFLIDIDANTHAANVSADGEIGLMYDDTSHSYAFFNRSSQKRIALYYRERNFMTLAEFKNLDTSGEEDDNGDVARTVTINEPLTVAYVAPAKEPMMDGIIDGFLVLRDNSMSTDRVVTPATGQKEFLIKGVGSYFPQNTIKQENYTQNNWLLVQVLHKDGVAPMSQRYHVGDVIKANTVSGLAYHLLPMVLAYNGSIQPEVDTEVEPQTVTYNTYAPGNFNDANLNLNGVPSQTTQYFHMSPKRMEVANITYAVYNNGGMYSKSGVEAEGGFWLDFDGNIANGKYGEGEGQDIAANTTIGQVFGESANGNAYEFRGIVLPTEGWDEDGDDGYDDEFVVVYDIDTEHPIVHAPRNMFKARRLVEKSTPSDVSPNNNLIVRVLDIDARNDEETSVITGIEDIINAEAATVKAVRYYNVAGMESDKPFDGMNIIVTEFNDGSTTTNKVLK